MSKLVNGLILKGCECPYKVECGDFGKNHCKHTGVAHQVDFSCGIARAHEQYIIDQEEKVLRVS